MTSHGTSPEYEILPEDDPRLDEIDALCEKIGATLNLGSVDAATRALLSLLDDFFLDHPDQFYHPKELDHLKNFANRMSDDPRWAEMETLHMLWLFRLDNGHLPTSSEEVNAWYIRTKPKRLMELTRMDLQDILDKMIAAGYAVEIASLH
jgi:hypothetical protein